MRNNLLLELLYPPRCPVCDEAVPFGRRICPDCRKKLALIREPWCMKCGRPLTEDTEYCDSCRREKHYFHSGRSLYRYRSAASGMYRLKNAGRQEYAEVYAQEIVKHLGGYIRSLGDAVLVPVPVHPRKERKRGYNQAELLAREIGHLMGLPVAPELVRRVDDTKAAKLLNGRERGLNLKNAFKLAQNSVKWKTAIIIDDIFTTGATVDGVAKALSGAGVSRIHFVCVSSGDGVSSEERK